MHIGTVYIEARFTLARITLIMRKNLWRHFNANTISRLIIFAGQIEWKTGLEIFCRNRTESTMHSASAERCNMFHREMEVRFGRSSGRKVIGRDWIKLFDFPISDITGVNVEFSQSTCQTVMRFHYLFLHLPLCIRWNVHYIFLAAASIRNTPQNPILAFAVVTNSRLGQYPDSSGCRRSGRYATVRLCIFFCWRWLVENLIRPISASLG